MEFEHFYDYIEFYCVHRFHVSPHMLVYGRYHKVSIHDELVEDLGPTTSDFADITVVEYLFAKVTGHEGRGYFVDAQNTMEERLRKHIEVYQLDLFSDDRNAHSIRSVT